MTTIKRLTYEDPIVENQLRAYADDRGFAQLTLSRVDNPNVLFSVRLRDEDLDALVEVLRAARTAEEADRG